MFWDDGLTKRGWGSVFICLCTTWGAGWLGWLCCCFAFLLFIQQQQIIKIIRIRTTPPTIDGTNIATKFVELLKELDDEDEDDDEYVELE